MLHYMSHTLLLVDFGRACPAGIVVMGATNRKDVLDPALTRPGRCDVDLKADQQLVAAAGCAGLATSLFHHVPVVLQSCFNELNFSTELA